MQVSIIVPVYNTSKYLRRCADNLVGQSLTDIEIIFINDGSTDDSLEILEEYKRAYPDKVKVVSKKNGGQATARNLGITLATGDYIAFADSDDFVEEDMFKTMYESAIKNDADYVECYFHFIEDKNGDYKELKTRGEVRAHKDNKDMFINPQVSPWNKLYKASILKENNIKFPEGLIYEDTAFFIKTIPFIKTSNYVSDPFVHYFLRVGSTMNSKSLKAQQKTGDIILVLKDIIDFYKDNGFYEEYKKELEYFISKILLCSNISRIGRVTDKKLKKKLIRDSFYNLENWFPEYKKNPYYQGKLKTYINFISPYNAGLISLVLARLMRG